MTSFNRIAVISTPFQDFDLVVGVKFRTINLECPSQLSLKDMIVNNLDISIQDKSVTFKHKLQGLLFENDFLVHRWKFKNIEYAM